MGEGIIIGFFGLGVLLGIYFGYHLRGLIDLNKRQNELNRKYSNSEYYGNQNETKKEKSLSL